MRWVYYRPQTFGPHQSLLLVTFVALAGTVGSARAFGQGLHGAPNASTSASTIASTNTSAMASRFDPAMASPWSGSPGVGTVADTLPHDLQTPSAPVSCANGASSLSGHVAPTFSGACNSFGLLPQVRLTAVAGPGDPAFGDGGDFLLGTGLDVERLTPHLSAGLFALQHTVDDSLGRRLLGGHLSFELAHTRVHAAADYDTGFHVLNEAWLRGTHRFGGDVTLGLQLGTHAVAPGWSDPALARRPAWTLPGYDPLHMQDVPSWRERVAGDTAYARQAQATLSMPLNTRWRTSWTAQLDRTGAIAPNLALPMGQPDSGGQWTYALQLNGDRLFSKRDTNAFKGALVRAPNFNATRWSYGNDTALSDAWHVVPSLRYEVDDDPGGRSRIYGPRFRFTYHPAKSWTLESGLNVELTRRITPLGSDNTNSVDYFLGYRYTY